MRKDWEPSIRIELASRELMRFIYAGRVKEGIQPYNRIWKLYKKIHEGPEDDGDLKFTTACFKAYAYFETGQKSAGLEEIWKRLPEDHPAKYQYDTYLGDYYYIKNDFKTALKYYSLADQCLNIYTIPKDPRKPIHRRPINQTYSSKIKLLQDLLKN